MEQINPPATQPGAMQNIIDHAKHHQGGGTTGEIGGDRPAEMFTSPLAHIDGRAQIPGDNPQALGELHWDDNLSHPMALARLQITLRTLRDAGDLLSGMLTNMVHCSALQTVAKKLVRAAKTGTPADIFAATDDIDRVVWSERLI